MGATTEFIKSVINSTYPNSALIAKAEDQQLLANIRAQKDREDRFYKSITMCDPQGNPYPIKNIHDLNNLITIIDRDYNLNALLPAKVASDSGIGGEVERILNEKKGYDLTLRGKNQFDEQEQIRIAEALQTLANEAFNIISNDNQIITGITNAAEEDVWKELLAMMSVISGKKISNGVFTLFITEEEVNKSKGISQKTKQIFNDLIHGKTVPLLKMRTFHENVTGSYRTRRKKESFEIIRDTNQKNQTRDITEVKINPNFNQLSDLAFNQLYAFAEMNDLLNPELHRYKKYDKYGNELKSPMDQDPQIWQQDVCDAVLQAIKTSIGFKTNPVLQQKLTDLLSTHQIADKIALNRSFSSLRGFLGELRAFIIVNLLFPYGTGEAVGNAKVQLTNAIGKQDAPVDIFATILKEIYGIQVKNIEDMEFYSWGNISNSGGMSINSFYNNRLQSPMDESEINFFGAYSYNKPIANRDTNPYSDIYGGFESQFNAVFVPVYEKLAMYIIRQVAELKQEFNKMTHMQNDFFLMGKNFVPASSFMFALKDNDTDMINSTFEISSTSPEYGFYSSSHKKPENYSNYLKYTKINYSVNVNFAEMLRHSAYAI